MKVEQTLLQSNGAVLVEVTWPNGRHAWDIMVEPDGSLRCRCVETKDGRIVGLAVKPECGNAISMRQASLN